MSKPFPALCKDCKHSKAQTGSGWNLLCLHPKVNAKDPWALSRADTHDGGSNCKEEREKMWLAQCGMSGKLWEQA